MGDMQTFMGNPSVGFFMMILIGAIAGWIAEKVTASDHGIFTNILIGIAGAFVGVKLAEVVSNSGVRVFPHPDRRDHRRDRHPVHLAAHSGQPAVLNQV